MIAGAEPGETTPAGHRPVHRWLFAIVLLLALAVRVAWIIRRGADSAGGEAQQVAVAVAEGFGFADAYFVGSGPTAHLMPTTPLLAGGVYAVLGVRSFAAELFLQLLAFVEIGVGWWLMVRLFGRLGVAMPARAGSLALLALVPVFIGVETLDFRYWEGALAVLLGTAGLGHAVALARRDAPATGREIAMICALFAITFLVSPSVALAIGACYFVVLVVPFSIPRIAMAGGGVVLALAIVLTPWTLRNAQVFGVFMPLRSNAGLEMAIANTDDAARESSKAAFGTAMLAFHPSVDGAGRQGYIAMGEIAYMKSLTDRNHAWIRAHPADFARLCLRHLRQMFFPDGWQFQIGSGKLARERALIVSLVSVLGLFGLAWRIAGRSPGWRLVALYIGVIALTYVPFQPMARYLYLIYAPMMFCAGDTVWRVIVRWRGRRAIPAGI